MALKLRNSFTPTLCVPNPATIGDNNAATKKSKESQRCQRRRKLKKSCKTGSHATACEEESDKENSDPQKAVEQVMVEYVSEKVDLEGLDDDFRKVFEKFYFTKASTGVEDNDVNKDEAEANSTLKKKSDYLESDEEKDQQQKDKSGFITSNKKKKLQSRMKLAELKLISQRPDVVEVWDAASSDPKLLIFLKSYRNTVPVPTHWCQKRKYLQGKRGIDKKPFQLPDVIAATGIEKLREAYLEKESHKKVKQKQRDRMQPKLGRVDLDYEHLYEASLKFPTYRPKLSSLGDLYYEGKEFEVKQRRMKPGTLSKELKEALGMLMTEGAPQLPPPWLINMQRYGPPPSYPHLKIPGLNAPIPPGDSFGCHLGGWGRPPVDMYGTPLYGDVFGQRQELPNYEDYEEEPVDKTIHWGDFDKEAEEEEEEEVEVEEQEEKEKLEDEYKSVDTVSRTPTGNETPEVIELRKQPRNDMEKSLYKVLEEKEEKIGPGILLGTSHTYVIGESSTQGKVGGKKVEVSLDPEELEGMENVLPAKYEQAREEEKLRNQREDFSDMVAENSKKRKRKMQDKDKSKKNKYNF